MREGWRIEKLNELALLITKGTTPTSVGFNFTSEGVNFIKVECIAQNGELIKSKFGHIDEECHGALLRSQLVEHDILFSIAGALGRTAIVDSVVLPANTNQALAIIRLKKEVDVVHRYVLLALGSGYVLSQVDKFKGGVAQQNLSLAQIRSFEIPVPPIEEQYQIVTLLDQAFAAINQAKANIEQNIQNAKELFQSKLNEIFSQKGEGWEENKLKNVCVLQRGFDLPTRLREKGKYDLVTSSGIKDSHSEFKVEGPGVVTGRSGSIGNVFYIENDFWPLNTTLYIKDFKGNNEKYIYYFLTNFDLAKYASGAGVPTLNRNFVHDESAQSTSDFQEQRAIVETLDFLKVVTDKWIDSCQQKLVKLEELKRSLLQKAFSGELTVKEATA